MKNSAIFLLLGILLYPACRKNSSSPFPPDSQLTIKQAEAYFNDSVLSVHVKPENYRAGIAKTVLWDDAIVIDKRIVVIRVHYNEDLVVQTSFGGNHYFGLSNFTQLFIYKDSSKRYHAEIVTTFPDTSFILNPTGRFSGIRLVENWQGHPIKDLLYQNGIAKSYSPTANSKEATAIIHTCTTILGYNYSEGSGDDPVDWTESGGCTDRYIADDPEGSMYSGGGDEVGSSGGGSTSGSTIVVYSPTNPILNTKQYFNCFVNTASNTYKVTVCVDQPYPGTRSPWAFSPYNASSGYSNIVDPGHTFLILTQSGPAGTISRNVGFYPGGKVNPITHSTQGALGNDQDHDYDISGSFSVNGTMFLNIINYVSQGNTPGYSYDLNTNNCTTFAINALATGHIYLPSTLGYWLGGLGNDPGDLGEDIRNNPIPGMTRSTIETTHSNVGTCQ